MRWWLTVLAMLAIAGGAGVACGSAAATSCADRVVADWSDGRIDGTYQLHCYEKAVDDLPEDVRAYSSAVDDISRALQERVRTEPRGETSTMRAVDAFSASDGGASGSRTLVYVLAASGILLATFIPAAWAARRARRRR